MSCALFTQPPEVAWCDVTNAERKRILPLRKKMERTEKTANKELVGLV